MNYLLVDTIDTYEEEGGGVHVEEHKDIESIHKRMAELLKDWGSLVSISVYIYLTRMDAEPEQVTTKLKLVKKE